MKNIRADPKKNLYCLDNWSDDLFVGGDEAGKNFQTLEVLMVPCNYIHTPGPAVNIPKECIADLDKQMEYMGPLEMVLYVN